MLIKIVAFDYGGVLGSDSDEWKTTFAPVSSLTGLSTVQLQKIFNESWPLLETGEKKVEFMWSKVVALSTKKVTIENVKKLYDECIAINNEVLDIAKRVKNNGYKIIILSNASFDWAKVKQEKYKLDEIFDKLYISAHLGVAKPDPRIYNIVLEDLKIHPKQLLFIDNLEKNIESAKKLGINTIKYTSSGHLETELKYFGILS